MATNLTVNLTDQPGALAAVAEALGNAGVNIDGISGTTIGGQGVVQLLFEQPGSAQSVIESAGANVVGSREVLVVAVEDKPGVLGSVTRKLADAGVNLELAYLAAGTKLVFGVDDMEAARNALA